MNIIKKQSGRKIKVDSFTFTSNCIQVLCADYIEYRIIYRLEPLTLAFPSLYKAIEIVEKSLKVFITSYKENEDVSSWLKNDFGHNIEKLRAEASKINSFFDEQDIKDFTHPFDDKRGDLYQHIRYGSNIDGFEAFPNKILPVVDKIFFRSLLLLNEKYRDTLNFCSPLKGIVTAKFDQTMNRDLILKLLKQDNEFIAEYENYCIKLDNEYQRRRLEK